MPLADLIDIPNATVRDSTVVVRYDTAEIYADRVLSDARILEGLAGWRIVSSCSDVTPGALGGYPVCVTFVLSPNPVEPAPARTNKKPR